MAVVTTFATTPILQATCEGAGRRDARAHAGAERGRAGRRHHRAGLQPRRREAARRPRRGDDAPDGSAAARAGAGAPSARRRPLGPARDRAAGAARFAGAHHRARSRAAARRSASSRTRCGPTTRRPTSSASRRGPSSAGSSSASTGRSSARTSSAASSATSLTRAPAQSLHVGVVIHGHERPLDRVVVVVDETDDGRAALELAARCAADAPRRCTSVLVPPPGRAPSRRRSSRS